jgi:hypothetical protein
MSVIPPQHMVEALDPSTDLEAAATAIVANVKHLSELVMKVKRLKTKMVSSICANQIGEPARGRNRE